MLSWVVINRQHLPRAARGPGQTRKSCPIRALPLLSFLLSFQLLTVDRRSRPCRDCRPPYLPISFALYPLFPLPHLSPLLPVNCTLFSTTAAHQLLCNQFVTHSFHGDGGYPPSLHFASCSTARHSTRCSSSFFSDSCALSCAFLHSPKSQLVSFQSLPHSFQKTTRVGEGGQIAD